MSRWPTWLGEALVLRRLGAKDAQIAEDVEVPVEEVTRQLDLWQVARDPAADLARREPPWLSKARRMRVEGATIRAIAAEVGASKSAVQRWLSVGECHMDVLTDRAYRLGLRRGAKAA